MTQLSQLDFNLSNGDAGKQVNTVIQPDLCVIFNEDNLSEQGCVDAPDWIICPCKHTLHPFVLFKATEKQAPMTIFSNKDRVTSDKFPDLKDVFAE